MIQARLPRGIGQAARARAALAVPRWSVALVTLVTLACGDQRRARPGIPPHTVLLVTVDGMRADHVSAWTYARATTWIDADRATREAGGALSIDDLAEEGVLFARAFAPSTEALASLAALHTGRSPLESGIAAGGDLESAEDTLAERFSRAGFQTLALVARQAGALGPGWQQGFDRFERTDDDLEAVLRGRAWIDERDFGSGARSFVWLHLEGPAPPFEPGTLEGIDFRSLFAAATPDADSTTALYDGEIARSTHVLRGLLAHLHEAGGPADAWGGTLLAFVGLGGLELGAPGAESPSARARPSEGALHVPVFLRHPDSLTGRRIFRPLVTLQDVHATLLEWFDLPAQSVAGGRSLLSLTDEWRGRAFPLQPLLAVGGSDHETGPAVSLRNDRWRLIVWPPEAGVVGASERIELFDLDRDPGGRIDVAAEHANAALELRGVLSTRLGALSLAPRYADAGWPR